MRTKLLAVPAFVIGALLFQGSQADPAAAEVVTVNVGSFYFEDASTGSRTEVRVNIGDQLRFVFESSGHSADVDELGISTGTQGFGGSGEALSLPGGTAHMSAGNPTALDFNNDFTWHAYVKTSASGAGSRAASTMVGSSAGVFPSDFPLVAMVRPSPPSGARHRSHNPANASGAPTGGRARKGTRAAPSRRHS